MSTTREKWELSEPRGRPVQPEARVGLERQFCGREAVEARAGPHPPPVPRDLNPTPPRGYSPAHRTEKGLLCRWLQKKPG